LNAGSPRRGGAGTPRSAAARDELHELAARDVEADAVTLAARAASHGTRSESGDRAT